MCYCCKRNHKDICKAKVESKRKIVLSCQRYASNIVSQFLLDKYMKIKTTQAKKLMPGSLVVIRWFSMVKGGLLCLP